MNEEREELMHFLKDKEVAATITPSVWDNHTIEVSEVSFHRLQKSLALSYFFISKVTYHKVVALLKKDTNPIISLSLETEFFNEPQNNVNILVDIEDEDSKLKDEIVLAVAHFGIWHGGGYASDKNAVFATNMEAFRILQNLNIKLKRAIRAGFWGGEEQEFYDSVDYLKKHLGDPLNKKCKPERSKLSVYYNIDSEGEAIRGFFVKGNKEAQKIAKPLGEELKKWKLETITSIASHGSDYLLFDAANITSFDTFQDLSLYWSLQHHTNIDEISLIDEKTIKRNAVVMAILINKTALMDELMPRK